MVTIDDILHHIAQDLRCYSDVDPKGAIEAFVTGCMFDMRISITTDLEETELNYLNRYGQGRTFYFRLPNYERGKALAAELFYLIRGIRPDMSSYTGDKFNPQDALYLFLHLGSINPPPVTDVLPLINQVRLNQILQN